MADARRSTDGPSVNSFGIKKILHDKTPRSQPKNPRALASICCFFCPLLWICLTASSALGQETRLVIDSLRVEENRLVVDFHVDSLLTTQLLNGMQRGLTSSAQFRVQLWRKRSSWFGSTLLAERQYDVKSTYDPWEQKYVLATAAERRLTSALDLVRNWWEQHHGVRLIETKQLQPTRRYFVTIELIVEPVSKESLNEIRGWLAGEVKTAAQRDSTQSDSLQVDNNKRESVPDRLLSVLINLTGFGKRVLTAQSEGFRVNGNGGIEWEK